MFYFPSGPAFAAMDGVYGLKRQPALLYSVEPASPMTFIFLTPSDERSKQPLQLFEYLKANAGSSFFDDPDCYKGFSEQNIEINPSSRVYNDIILIHFKLKKDPKSNFNSHLLFLTSHPHRDKKVEFVSQTALFFLLNGVVSDCLSCCAASNQDKISIKYRNKCLPDNITSAMMHVFRKHRPTSSSFFCCPFLHSFFSSPQRPEEDGSRLLLGSGSAKLLLTLRGSGHS